jgi:transglutaminase-like putative cysteine protease
VLPRLLRFVNRFQPREGWIPFLLAVLALLCAPAAILIVADELDADGLLLLTVLAAIVGLRLARSRLSAKGATVLAGLLGGGLTTLLVGRILPPLSLLWVEISRIAAWLSHGRQGIANQPWPFVATFTYVGQRFNILGTRLWWWGRTAASGGVATDPIVLMLAASSLTWVLSCFATWQLYRHKAALVGLLPSGVAVTTIAFFGGGLTNFYLILYLFCTLWLIATTHLRAQQERWQRTGADYPGDLGMELIFTLAPALTLVLLLAAFFPVIGPRQVSEAFWKVMERPWSTVERASERLFGPIESSGGPRGPGSPGSGGTLPRSHLLGGGPELSETIVLYVTTNDPVPPPPDPDAPEKPMQTTPRRYWRSMTYDTYTGRGWINNPLEESSTPPGSPLEANLPPGFELVQQVNSLLPGPGPIFAVNAPLQIDQAVQTWWHAPGDLAQMTGASDRYTVISHPPEPSVAELRDALPFVPPDLAERYLSLPDTVPQRVLDLAQQVAGGQETRYEQARIMETYLRAYTYTLDLPAPPADRDLVDYFLFDVQQGYCDYYASAMVVMARAVGIPARLATGYAQGTYDYDQQRWVVTEKDGHTWVEVYFDGIGWVEFEPTAGLPALEHPGGERAPEPLAPPLPARALRWWQRVPWVLVGMAMLVLLAVAIVVWVWRPRQQQAFTAPELVRDRHTRLLQWGMRLGKPLRDGQTASEYGTVLSEALQARSQRSRWQPVRRAGIELPPEVTHLTGTFVRTQYCPEPPTDREGWQIHDLWTRLRRHLWWLWLGRQ